MQNIQVLQAQLHEEITPMLPLGLNAPWAPTFEYIGTRLNVTM